MDTVIIKIMFQYLRNTQNCFKDKDRNHNSIKKHRLTRTIPYIPLKTFKRKMFYFKMSTFLIKFYSWQLKKNNNKKIKIEIIIASKNID